MGEAAGGWDCLVPPGLPVLLNPNLMSAREPARAVTTHPLFCEVLARIWRERGREVLIGDSPAGAVRGLRRVWEATGVAEAARAAGARLVSLETEGSVARPVASRFLNEIRLTALADTAAVVSLPKLKTHFLTILTGALKNGLGLIPGLAKAEFHRLAPHPDDFAELLVDIAPALQPAFTFVDAVVGLEGDGPASGEVRPFGLVVAGANAAAVDIVLTRLCGFEAEEVPTVRLSLARKLAPPEPEVVLLGLRETDLVFDDVAAPGSLWLRHLPRPVLRFAGKQFVIRPAVREEACTGCRACVESCPVGAARMEGERAVIDPAKCIQCLCCYETCADEAVYLRPSRAARLYYGFRDFRRRWRDRRRGT
ncbi:MAG: DUF362 domain-containing protein [Candidatus Coatesbacteria bacterium]|nr:MAG: DUF362 domain-containing protein [Candidatus Coatesbacteria bacterium]